VAGHALPGCRRQDSEKDIFIDFNEAERTGSNEQVQIVSQRSLPRRL
jgi:hypothetical protein